MRRRRPLPMPPPPRDPGQRAVTWINNLTHIKGAWAGQSFGLRPWQEQRIVRPLFGTVKNGVRQYRTCYIEIPRKNGKTELAAAIALYMLLGDGEAGAEVYSAAGDLDQASIAFNVAAQMVRNDPQLSERLQIIPSRRRIVDPVTGSVYRAIPADAPTAHGYNASALIADELHVWRGRELWDVLTTSMGARRQPLTFVITTAGWDRKSICYQMHTYAQKVAAGAIVAPTFLPVLYGAPREADWRDETVWREANPALEDFRELDEMRVAAAQAREMPAQQNTFRRLYLCQWTEQAEKAISLPVWDEAAAPVDPVELEGRLCFAGLDLASSRDVAAFVLVFPPIEEDEPFQILAHFWVPKENLARRVREDGVEYDVWADQGLLTPTGENEIDYDVIRAYIRDAFQRFRILEIAYDRWGAVQLAAQLRGDGLVTVPINQGFSGMAAATAEFLKRVAAHSIAHGGNPVLRWMASNFAVKQNAEGYLRPDKASSSEKIDGIVALIMALSRVMAQEGRFTAPAPTDALIGPPRTTAAIPW